MNYNWQLNRFLYKLPNRPFAKTAKDNKMARLVDLNALIDDINEILSEVSQATSAPSSCDCPVCDINMEPEVAPIIGGNIDFIKTSFGNEVDVIEPGVLEIARGNEFSIFNQATESGYTGNFSPEGTQWNSIYTDPNNYGYSDLYNVEDRIFGTFDQACNFNPLAFAGGLEMVMKSASGALYLVSFAYFNDFASGAGFRYVRSDLTSGKRCKIVFSDGTSMSTTPAPSVNTWDMSEVAFVSPNGDDGSGVVGDGNKPFLTINQAMTQSTKVMVLPGNHFFPVNVSVKGVEVYAMDGAVFYSGFTVNNVDVTDFKVFGKGIFLSQGTAPITARQNAKVHFEFNYIDSPFQAFFALDNAEIHMYGNYMRSLGDNGAANSASCRDNAKVYVNLKEDFTVSRAIFLRNGDIGPFTGKLIINCKNLIMDDRLPTTSGAGSIFFTSTAGAFYIEANCNIYHLSGVTSGQVVFEDFSSIGATIKINGFIYAPSSTVAIDVKDSQSYLEITGKIFAPAGRALSLVGTDVATTRCVLKDCQIESLNSILVGAGRTIEFLNSFVKVTDASAIGAVVFDSAGSSVCKFKSYGSVFEVVNIATGVLVGGTPITLPETDSVKSSSNVAYDVAFSDNWDGPTVIASLEVPELQIPIF